MNTNKTPGHIKLDEKNHVEELFSGATGGVGLDCSSSGAETKPTGFLSGEPCRGGTAAQTAEVA